MGGNQNLVLVINCKVFIGKFFISFMVERFYIILYFFLNRFHFVFIWLFCFDRNNYLKVLLFLIETIICTCYYFHAKPTFKSTFLIIKHVKPWFCFVFVLFFLNFFFLHFLYTKIDILHLVRLFILACPKKTK